VISLLKEMDNFLDSLRRIKRGPAIILQKDIGIILANTSITKNSKVLDAGSGSGVLTVNLARFVKKVYSYEINQEFFKLAQENFNNLGIKNIELKNSTSTGLLWASAGSNFTITFWV